MVGGAGALGVALAGPVAGVQLVHDQVDTDEVLAVADEVARPKPVPVGVVVQEVGVEAAAVLLHAALEAEPLTMLLENKVLYIKYFWDRLVSVLRCRIPSWRRQCTLCSWRETSRSCSWT